MNPRLTAALALATGIAVATVAVAQDTPKPLSAEMQNHWTVGTSIRDAVIFGDHAGARVIAKGLAERPAPEALPEPLRPFYAEMQAAADEIARSPSIETAAAGVGRMALTCSECHDFTGGGPKPLVIPMPPPAIGAGDNDMPMHKWGIDWLWVGLISADPESWERGAKGLEEAPFHKHPEFPESGRGLEAMEHLTHLLAGLADKDDRPAQAQRFGETLTACALCHTAPEEEPDAQETQEAPEPPPAPEAPEPEETGKKPKKSKKEKNK